MNNPQNIKALVFDAYGTLFDTDSVASVCEELFPNNSENLIRIWRRKQLEYTWLRSLMGKHEDFWKVTEDALIYACENLELECKDTGRKRLMEEYLRLEPFPEVRDSLKALSNRKISILSNGSHRMLESVAGNSQLREIFSLIISADEASIFKPSPKVYQLACDKLNEQPSSIGFVSSNSWDIIGAKSFGFTTFWVNRQKETLDKLDFSVDVTVSDLVELVGIFK